MVGNQSARVVGVGAVRNHFGDLFVLIAIIIVGFRFSRWGRLFNLGGLGFGCSRRDYGARRVIDDCLRAVGRVSKYYHRPPPIDRSATSTRTSLPDRTVGKSRAIHSRTLRNETPIILANCFAVANVISGGAAAACCNRYSSAAIARPSAIVSISIFIAWAFPAEAGSNLVVGAGGRRPVWPTWAYLASNSHGSNR